MGIGGEGWQMDKDLEALKLVVDWSKWIVTLQPVAIAAIGGLVKLNESHGLSFWSRLWVIASIACFLYSILVAATLLYSMPRAIAKLPLRHNASVYGIETHEERHYRVWYNALLINCGLLKKPFTVRTFARAEHLGFLWGIVFFGLFVITIAR